MSRLRPPSTEEGCQLDFRQLKWWAPLLRWSLSSLKSSVWLARRETLDQAASDGLVVLHEQQLHGVIVTSSPIAEAVLGQILDIRSPSLGACRRTLYTAGHAVAAMEQDRR